MDRRVACAGLYYREFTAVRQDDGAWHWGWMDWNYSAGRADDFYEWVDHFRKTRKPETLSIPAVWRAKEDRQWLLDRGIHRERA